MAPDRMDIYSLPGTRVVFNHPEAGYAHDIAQAKRWLTLGATYTVERTQVHAFSTNVWLRELADKGSFNSVHFDTAEDGSTPPDADNDTGDASK